MIADQAQKEKKRNSQNKIKTRLVCEKAEACEDKTIKENGKYTTHDVSSLLEPFEVLQKKYSLYNVKLGRICPSNVS